jgi:hypothetical protein
MALNARALLSAVLLATASVNVQADKLSVDLDSEGEHDCPHPVPSCRLGAADA